MTQDEIIEMARQAGCFEKHQVFYFTQQDLEAFTKLVEKKEREACAKVCDKLASDWHEKHHPLECARQIRAREQA
jgi:hypothetical protein